jgi:hypothetical protein
MAARTFSARIVLIRVNSFDFRSFTGRIRKISMAPEAEFAAPVKDEFLRISRMLDSRPMTIFTLNSFMTGGVNLLLLFSMAGLTVFLSLIFYLKGLPFLLIRLSIPAVHVTSLMDSKILGYYHGPSYQD